MDSKTFNELLKATKSSDPDVLGRAYVRAVAISMADFREASEYEFPQIVEAIIARAKELFRVGTVGYKKFTNYTKINRWISNNRYFALLQQSSFQRDTLMLKIYAERFTLAEQVIQASPGEKALSTVYPYTLEAYMNNIPTEPFDGDNERDVGKNANDRLHYAYSWCVAYNTVIEITAQVFDVPELRLELLNLSDDIDIYENVDALFRTLEMLIERNPDYCNAEKFSKYTGLKEFTYTADNFSCRIKPTDEAIVNTTAKIKDFSAFADDVSVMADMFPVIKEVLANE